MCVQKCMNPHLLLPAEQRNPSCKCLVTCRLQQGCLTACAVSTQLSLTTSEEKVAGLIVSCSLLVGSLASVYGVDYVAK